MYVWIQVIEGCILSQTNNSMGTCKMDASSVFLEWHELEDYSQFGYFCLPNVVVALELSKSIYHACEKHTIHKYLYIYIYGYIYVYI